MFGVPHREVVEPVEVEVRVELAVDHGQHVLVERGGHASAVVVGGDQPIDRLHKVGAEQERIARGHRVLGRAKERHSCGRLEIADRRTEERDEPPRVAGEQCQVPLEVTHDCLDLQRGKLGADGGGGVGKHCRINVERDEAA